MKRSRPLRYQILDSHDSPPPPGRPHASRGRTRKTQQYRAAATAIGQHLRACRFRDHRNGRGDWSLRSVANAAAISHTTLSQVETGKRRIVADDLLRLADVLGEDREALLVRAGYLPASALANRGQYQLTALERQLLDRLRARPALLPALQSLLDVLP